MLVSIFTFLFSCEKQDDEFLVSETSENLNTEYSLTKEEEYEKYTVLGVKNKIPCSVANMTKAFQSLMNNSTAIKHPDGKYSLKNTHNYVKFKPEDSIQYEKIINDTILAVSDEPFEYEIATPGSIYLDPEAKDPNFTFYYSVVPKNYELPAGVPYELIENLHFTEEDAIGDAPNEREEQILDFYEGLNTEALKIYGNLEEDEMKEHTYFLKDPKENLSYEDLRRLGLMVEDVQINYDLEPLDEKSEDTEGAARLFRRRKWRPAGNLTELFDYVREVRNDNLTTPCN